jgi:hypothetical protein
MKQLKELLRTPYPYLFLLTFAAVWLAWNYLKLPFSNPTEVVSYLPSIGYNPNNNMLRFAAATLLPAIVCFVYWLVANQQKQIQKRLAEPRLRYLLSGLIVAVSVLITTAMAIVQYSTNPANNQLDLYNKTYRYAQVDTFHEGEALGPAISYSDPDHKPYKDFVIVHGVAQDPIRAVLAFKLFGKHIGAVRAMVIILAIITFILFYFLLVLIFKGDLVRSTLGLLFFAALALPASTIPYWQDIVLPTQIPYRDIATIFFLAAAITGLRAFQNGRRKLAAGMGAVVGFLATASFANSIDRAIYIAVLSVVWLVMMLALTGRKAFVKTTLAWYGLGFVAGLGVLYVALKGAVLDFAQYILTISKHKELLDGMPFVRPNPGVALILLIIAVMVGATLYWLVRNLRKPLSSGSFAAKTRKTVGVLQQAIKEHHTLILLGITAVLFMRNALGRALLDHFYYSIQWLYVFLVYVALAYAYPLRKKVTFAISFLAIAALLFTGALYAGLAKGVNMADDTFPINVPDDQFVRKDYLETADYLKKNLSGEETFVTLTSEGIWYYLVDKPSPVKYPIIWYAFTKSERTKLADSIEDNKNIKFMVTNNNWSMNFDFVPNEARFPEIYSVLHTQFVPHVGFGQQTVWIRK